jgi:hypothetical protein
MLFETTPSILIFLLLYETTLEGAIRRGRGAIAFKDCPNQ